MRQAVRALVAVLTFWLAVSLAGPLGSPKGARAQATEGSILAVVGRQVAWLNLEAPRHRMVSHIATPGNALEVAVRADGSGMVVAVGGPFPGGGPRGADLLGLDGSTGDLTPIALRTEARESLNSPAWWPDGETLLFERQDLGGQPVGAPGQEVPRYPSRIERMLSDGSGRSVMLPDGRQPDAAPDGSSLVFARTTNRGAALLVWHQADGTTHTLVPEGRFADVAYPRFSPSGERIAFVAPQSGVGARPGADSLLGALFGPSVALAHGIPWDPWLMDVDGSNLHRAAETAADEPSVSWSPDGNQLFVYSGTGSFIVDIASGGSVSSLQYVQGYGPTVWLAGNP